MDKYLRLFTFFKILAVTIGGLLPASGLGSVHVKSEALEYLREWGEQNAQRIRSLDQEIKSVLMKSHNTELSPQLDPKTLPAYSQDLERLSLQRREHVLRQSFIDRLKFQVHQNYRGGDLKDFLSKSILSIAHAEALDPSGDLGFAKFCNFLSLAIREIPERNENLLAFTEGYTKFSTILNPVPPTQYVESRSYTNGFDSYNARSIEKEKAGDVVEERLAQLKALDQMARQEFEARTPILKPLTATLADKTDLSGQNGYRVSDPVTPQIQNTRMIENLPKLKLETEAQAPEAQVSSSDNPLELRIHMQDIHKPEDAQKSPETAAEAPAVAPPAEY